ncbi:MAG: hypothetical protein DHS20C11_34970 [Lysobacteraceae bacterium]|nr:MAG: hypothetical protein DHS20C11_34970 [Xanthomonadaceae bacterium]
MFSEVAGVLRTVSWYQFDAAPRRPEGQADPSAWLAKRSEVQKAERMVAISVSPWSISISDERNGIRPKNGPILV